MEAPLVVLDFGSQYTQLIARRAREQGVFSAALAGNSSLERVFALNPRAIILSGGPNSVQEEGAPLIDQNVLEKCIAERIPILGICYGMQCLVKMLSGQVRPASRREYGMATIFPRAGGSDVLPEGEQRVWMSHGDEVVALPADDQLEATAWSEEGTIVALEGKRGLKGCLYGLQYHPEVAHTEQGVETMRRFLFEVAKLEATWSIQKAFDTQVAAIQKQVGEEGHAICALSGGVDSAVAATMCHRAMGKRLHCVFVDNGLLRKGERERVEEALKGHLGIEFETVDASEEALERLRGLDDPERKRKEVGALFIDCFDRYKDRLARRLGSSPTFLVQGTLYPDVIESCPPQGKGTGMSHTIKSHHNVGGLPEQLGFHLVEPLRELFKDEVRQLGSLLGVPPWFLDRHPFPGPGLAVRVLGDVTADNGARLEAAREADHIFTSALQSEGLYDSVWQAFAAVLPVRAVGVQGDQRTRGYAIALRAITSTDGMTADWAPLSHSFLASVSARICNQVHSVNRVFYDITSKPPATVELE